MPLDFTAEIEKLKREKGKEEEAIETAKKLRYEIEQQMEKSFDMIEESQSEIKDFLNQREKEDEEHKMRTSEIVRKLEDDMINVDNDINDKIENKRENDSEGTGLDSKHGKTDNTTLSSKEAEPDDFSTVALNSQGKGPWNEQQLKLDDIPDVVESIKEHLIESMGMILSDEEERLREREENKIALDGKALAGNESHIGNDGLAVVKNGLICNTKSIDETPDIPLEETKILEETHERMKSDLENPSKIIENDKIGTIYDFVGSERVIKCRKLCRDIDSMESLLDNLSHIISNQTGNDSSSMYELADSVSDGVKGPLHGDEASAVFLVAELENDDELDNMIYKYKQAPAIEVDRKQPFEVLERKKDAEKKLNAMLGDLKAMLGQGNMTDVHGEKGKLLKDDSEELEMSGDFGNLKHADEKLQRELEKLCKVKKKIMDENSKLRQNTQETSKGRDGKYGSLLQHVGYLEIPRWANERKMKQNMDDIKKMVGELMYDGLLNWQKDMKVPFTELKDYQSLRLESRNLQNLLEEYKADNENLVEKLITASVANEINDLTKVENQNTKHTMEELQKEAERTEEILHENKNELEKNKLILNALVLERNIKLDEEEKLRNEKHLLQRQIAEINKEIHEFFPLLESNRQGEDLARRIKSIDNEISIIEMELRDESTAVNDEKMTEVRRLESLLEKVEPHVKKERKSQLETEAGKVPHRIPNDLEVDKAIKRKEDLKRVIDENSEFSGTQMKKEMFEGGGGTKIIENASMISSTDDDYGKKLDRLKRELESSLKELSNSGLEKDDGIYLREAIESLKVSIEETGKDLDYAKMQSGKASRVNEEIAEIEKKIEYLSEIVKEEEKPILSKDEQLNSGGALTQFNLREKIEDVCRKLREEKERLKIIIDSTQNLENERSISTPPDFIAFRKSFDENTAAIKSEIEECMDDVMRNLESTKDKLRSQVFESAKEGEKKELKQRTDKLVKLKSATIGLNRDLEVMVKFEREEEADEISDSDIEELVNKIEAIKVLINRMEKTIEGHIGDDGDAKTLEILMKRRDKMKETLDEAKNEMSRKKELLKRDLKELMNEKLRIESELRKLLGKGAISSDEEKLAMVELIDDAISQDFVTLNEANGGLKEYIVKRQNIAEDYTYFLELGGLTEENGELLSTTIDLVDLDIRERLEEILSDCNDYNERHAYENAYLNAILAARSELQGALYALENFDNDGGSKTTALKEMEKEDKSYMGAYKELKKLANNKIKAIDAKLDIFSDITESHAFLIDAKDDDKGDLIQSYKENDEEVEELLKLVKDEIASFQVIDKFDEDWNELTVFLLDEVNMKNETDIEINKLMDEREDVLRTFLKAKASSVDTGIDEKRYLDKLLNVDQRILDQITQYVDVNITIPSSATIADDRDISFEKSDHQANLFKSLLEERDFRIRQLFALKTRESGRKHNEFNIELVQSISTLKVDLENRLEQLDTRIKSCSDNDIRSSLNGTCSPNAFAMMKMIDEEIHRLSEEVNGKKLFLYGKKIPSFEENKGIRLGNEKKKDNQLGCEEREGIQLGTEEKEEGQARNEDESKEEVNDGLKEQIRALKEQREYLNLASEGQEALFDIEDLVEKKGELQRALAELQLKLEPLERKEQLEKAIEVLERELKGKISGPEDLNVENTNDTTEEIMSELNNIEESLARYALSIEYELGTDRSLNDKAIKLLNSEDAEQVMNILQQRLNELLSERIKLNLNYKEISEDLKDRNELQDLVDTRKRVIEELDQVESQIERLSDESVAIKLYEKRQEYEKITQRQKFLERKMLELQHTIGHLEQQKEVSFEDTTSGFSDNVEQEERNKELIGDLKQEIKVLELQNRKSQSELEKEQEKVTELSKEIDDNIETIEILEEELSRHQKEIEELNNAAEAMMEVASAMDEQNNARSLEIELNHDEIRELKNELKKAKLMDWDVMKRNFDAVEDKLKDKAKEVNELMDEKDEMNKEIKLLQEKVTEISDELSNAKAKTLELEKQITLLDHLKDELKSKGSRILKIDQDELYTTSPTEEDRASGGGSNDFRNEIDKVSAVEEIMKLAAGMKLENEIRLKRCDDLEAEKEELAQMVEDLLEKLQVQNEEIIDLRRKIKKKDELGLTDNASDGVQKGEHIVLIEPKNLINQSRYGQENDIDDLTTQVTILSNEKEELKDKLEDERIKSKQLESDLKSGEELLSSAENEIEELMGTVRNLFAKNDELKAMHLKGEQLQQTAERENAEKIRRMDEKVAIERGISSECKRKAEIMEFEKQELENEFLMASKKNDDMSRQIAELNMEVEDSLKKFYDSTREIDKKKALLLSEKEHFIGNLGEFCDEISSLKGSIELMKMKYEKMEEKSSKEINELKVQLQQTNEYCNELQTNFDRIRKAKEKMLVDYENRTQRLEEIAQNRCKEIMNEVDQRKCIEKKLNEERNEHNKQRVRFVEAENTREAEIEKLIDKTNKLKAELQHRERKIEQLELNVKEFSDLKNERKTEDNDMRMIKRDYDNKTKILTLDLEEAQNENRLLYDRVQRLTRVLAEKENDIQLIENEYQNELTDIRKKMVDDEITYEKEKSLEKIKGAQIESELKIYKTDSLTANAYISQLYEEKMKMNKELKGLEKFIKQIKEQNFTQIKSQDLQLEQLEKKNEELKRKISKTEEKLVKEAAENIRLKAVENEMIKVRGENLAYKEKLEEFSENLVYKKIAERFENDAKEGRDNFEKLKSESARILKHSNAVENEIKQVKGKMCEMKKEHEKEQNLLISNLEKEFRKKIEDIINSHLQEKERMLKMWDEERENWEAEMKEDLESSKNELVRQLRLQRIEMEGTHMNRIAEVRNENNAVVNQLNARLNELELERKQMESRLDEEVKSAENRFAAEKEYMVVLIRELLASLVDSKSRKSIMNKNHKSEIKIIEEAFEKEKEFMNTQLREELKFLRNKTREMLSKGATYENIAIEDTLDAISRKLC